jgi:hypothetical protein
MAFVVDTMMQALAFLRGEPLIAAAVATLLVAPGALACWFGYHLTGVRLAAGAMRPARFRRRRGAIDRVEQRLASLCTALSILTDSTESGLRAAIGGLERLSGAAPADESQTAEPATVISRSVDELGTDGEASWRHEGRSPRAIAIAEGVSEGEIRLRMRLQGAEL